VLSVIIVIGDDLQIETYYLESGLNFSSTISLLLSFKTRVFYRKYTSSIALQGSGSLAILWCRERCLPMVRVGVGWRGVRCVRVCGEPNTTRV
jgi:hypothetical protein